MTNQFLASFVMPVKDRGNLVKEAIKSVIDQTISNWELIIIDDNSQPNDLAQKVVQEFNDPRIRYFRLPSDFGHGQAAARNYGNALAQGKYILVTDSDDLSLPNRAELTIKTFKESQADIVYGEVLNWDPETNQKTERNPIWKARPFDLEYFKERNFIPHPASAYTRKIALEFPYNTFYRRSSDYDLFSRLAVNHKKFEFANEILTLYRKHDGAISRQVDPTFYIDMIKYSRGWIDKRPESPRN